ncbi:ABC transporter substrate-binding protein [Limimaricola pyoseonensis]|uniref:Peptide/nickel transport system substrate-binding protein n=1 Tax=Limimaricola pyoseonensis TaxID=521013 RepID=A0A1G7A5T8_9RHOB|nr:ABC transporter substrate-binding protein [Limimaricola pyoseonensis]SDE10013.1 peptide/nickel transport system substrate-binding protein [Limimaricola pyoseonensis]
MPPPRSAALHPVASADARELRAGRMSRREFLTRATALGVSAPAALGLAGLPVPGRAGPSPRPGGTLRVEMETRPIVDPRRAEWSQVANFYRGWLEYLVRYQRDGTLVPMLLERWEVDDAATLFTLHLREGVTWNNSDRFTADDVVRNIEGWCDSRVPGNSMALRMSALLDPATGRARPGAIERLDEVTVRLTLSRPDVSLIASMADYPAAIVHGSFDGGDPSERPVGTGPYLPETNEPGQRQVLVRNPDHDWWGTEIFGGPHLDRIEYLDYGTDPAAKLAAARAGEIDMTARTAGDFVTAFDEIGWTGSEVMSAATLAVRFNQAHAPYGELRVRRALQMAVDNAIILELGHGGRGLVADNHHVCPIHPDYAEVEPQQHDPAAARAALVEAGHGAHVFELVSLDDAWQARSCDAVAAQLLDAGISVERRVLPGPLFWDGWRDFPFSATEWNMRPLGVQVLSLAYRSNAPWNETGYANETFDQLLDEAMSVTDARRRSLVMARIERLLQEDGVLIQPYWRALFRHHAPAVRDAGMHPMFEHHHHEWWIDR